MWHSPEILTWDAWLSRQWRAAVQRGATPAAQLLSASQERALWEAVLQELAAGSDVSLAVHAAGLIQAAARATQSLLVLSRSAISEEENLLDRALLLLRRRCAERNLLSLRLAWPETLQFLQQVPAPVIAGQARLTPLQQALQQQYWNGESLLLEEQPVDPVEPQLRRAHSIEQELAACAAWCNERLRANGNARLLVLSACGDPSLQVQGALLWRSLAPGHRHDEALRQRLLGVEGGEPLRHQALVDDALAALEFASPAIDTVHLFALLRSPYFSFGTPAQLWDLQGWLEQRGIARWDTNALRSALATAAGAPKELPAAALLLKWLEDLRILMPPRRELCASDWAQCFNDALSAARFCRQLSPDSREYQRQMRWGELLDEFAGLDAVLQPMTVDEALRRLQRLAASARHQAASGDAAITLSDQLGDPLVSYDGIWVLALAENRWPQPPRPDPYVALSEQRRHQWPDAGVAERRAQAQWTLARWQQRSGELVLSYAEMEGDLHRRPTSLLQRPATQWSALAPETFDDVAGYAVAARDEQMPGIDAAALVKPLGGGVERLRIQQECAFRAQAQWRLAARPPEPLSDGITAALRGRLLHALLQNLWQQLRDQSLLLAMDAASEAALIERHWQAALREHPDTAWLPAGVLEREQGRTARLIGRVLQMERQRAPFAVEHCERNVEWQHGGARLRLRIDRIDRVGQGGRVVLDYKSGAAGTMKLQHGELSPLQLALYVAALAAQGEAIDGAALVSLAPGDLRYAGVAATEGLIPGAKTVEDWTATASQWQQGLQQLLQAHLAGEAQLAASLQACRYCPLPALCRRATPEDVEQPDE